MLGGFFAEIAVAVITRASIVRERADASKGSRVFSVPSRKQNGGPL